MDERNPLRHDLINPELLILLLQIPTNNGVNHGLLAGRISSIHSRVVGYRGAEGLRFHAKALVANTGDAAPGPRPVCALCGFHRFCPCDFLFSSLSLLKYVFFRNLSVLLKSPRGWWILGFATPPNRFSRGQTTCPWAGTPDIHWELWPEQPYFCVPMALFFFLVFGRGTYPELGLETSTPPARSCAQPAPGKRSPVHLAAQWNHAELLEAVKTHRERSAGRPGEKRTPK